MKRYTVYTQDARWYDGTLGKCGWKGACRTQIDDIDETIRWAERVCGEKTAWKIVDNSTKQVVASNV